MSCWWSRDVVTSRKGRLREDGQVAGRGASMRADARSAHGSEKFFVEASRGLASFSIHDRTPTRGRRFPRPPTTSIRTSVPRPAAWLRRIRVAPPGTVHVRSSVPASVSAWLGASLHQPCEYTVLAKSKSRGTPKARSRLNRHPARARAVPRPERRPRSDRAPSCNTRRGSAEREQDRETLYRARRKAPHALRPPR